MPDPTDAPEGPLVELAAAAGVWTQYVDHGGHRRTASRASLVAVLEAMGHARAGSDPAAALDELRALAAGALVEPVTVATLGEPGRVTLRSSARAAACELVEEDGVRRNWTTLLRANRRRGTARLALPEDLPTGYHELHVEAGGAVGSTYVLVRPARGGVGRRGASWRATGIAAPLFTLHRERGWGCGDLRDLEDLADAADRSGATVLATLPLLAGLLPPTFDPSPYLPLSRSFWHERWIDLDALLAELVDPQVAAIAARERASVLEAAARAHPLVDGEASILAKRAVLRAVLDATDDGHRIAGFDAFVAARPDVVDFASFLGAAERHGANWAAWPARLRDGALAPDDADAATVRLQCLAQFVMDGQLRRLAARLGARDQVLGLDLPLGVHPWGYDVWRHRDQFLSGLAVGAPPDRFFPGGQDWSMPFPDPAAARRSGHLLFRRALRHHLGVAGLLRIDHILGFQRLFCIPPGMPPSDGVYVTSPLDELVAVLLIEGYRSRAEIVGEDLGTVDAAVRRAMQREGIRRSFVVELSVRLRGHRIVPAPPAASVASFTTHDLPTFEEWWSARDVDERLAIDKVDAATAEVMRTARLAERRRLERLAARRGRNGARPREVLETAMEVLAESGVGLVVAQLDDLAEEREAVNLPGTSSDERPSNWQRRTRLPLEALLAAPSVSESVARLDAARGPAPRARHRGDVVTSEGPTLLDDDDLRRMADGTHTRLYDVLGAHPMEHDGRDGAHVATWAPRAAFVEVIGDLNGWDGRRHPLFRRPGTGIFEGFVPGLTEGARYQLRVGRRGLAPVDKIDPFAARTDPADPRIGVVHAPGHRFDDADWIATRAATQALDRPISVYEVHLGSWRRVVEEDRRPLRYAELGDELARYATRHGYTHVELMPVMEHPLYASWGYQVTSFFAPSARYGRPDEFAALVDELHAAGLGVICDWVPSHFPADAFGLAAFDGEALYEHADPKRSVHPEWKSLLFDYGRGEVRSFLLSAASSWIGRYHADGLRFDAVASMLYLDYARGPGEWEPNRLGGRENLEAVDFLRSCNTALHAEHPGVLTMAEESSAWPGVTAPVEDGGLGFDYKWDLGWMHDTLNYLAVAPSQRRHHHDRITFRSLYATSEQFVLPLSHDEVVHGKGSLLTRMPGEGADRAANLRLLFGLQLVQPGKKLLFMGGEFGQVLEWAHDHSLDWHLLDEASHAGIRALVDELNELYRCRPELHRDDLDDRGFRWIDGSDAANSTFCVERHDGAGRSLVVVLNAGPVPLEGYEVGAPHPGRWALECSSDDERFGGGGHRVRVDVVASAEPLHGRPQRLALDVPALGFVIYGFVGDPLAPT